jgi:hypothetical protein
MIMQSQISAVKAASLGNLDSSVSLQIPVKSPQLSLLLRHVKTITEFPHMIFFSDISRRNYHSSLRNSPEEHGSLLTYSVYLSGQHAVTKYLVRL